MLRVEHDPEVHALYVYLSDKPYAGGRDLDDQRRIDYAEDGTPVGVEILYADHGVDLSDLPRADEIAAALRLNGIRIFA